jgi:hypothetical protein
MDMQNAYNYPWFSRIASVNVTASNFGRLNLSPNSEAREIVLSADRHLRLSVPVF